MCGRPLPPAARKRIGLFDKALPQDQAELESLFDTLQTLGRVLVIVDGMLAGVESSAGTQRLVA